jgi:hypothetical protein
MMDEHLRAESGSTAGRVPPSDRYGRTRTPAERRRRAVVAAVVAAALGLGTVIWAAFGVVNVPVRTQEAGFAIIDDATIELTFVVAKAPAAVARCRIRALNPSFAEVGARDVLIGASEFGSVQVTAQIATSERATTALVQECRVVAGP